MRSESALLSHVTPNAGRQSAWSVVVGTASAGATSTDTVPVITESDTDTDAVRVIDGATADESNTDAVRVVGVTTGESDTDGWAEVWSPSHGPSTTSAPVRQLLCPSPTWKRPPPKYDEAQLDVSGSMFKLFNFRRTSGASTS